MGGIVGMATQSGQIEITQEQLQKFCVHVFRDIETTETYIKSKCIRCGLERTYNLTT